MTRWLGAAVAAAFLGAMAGGTGAVAPEGATSAPTPPWVAEATNAFAVDLYARLAAAEGNLFFSPASLETALGMTYAGARGRTADQMAAVLHLPKGGPADAALHRALGGFSRDLSAAKGAGGQPRPYEFAVANALWGQTGYRFLPEFLGLVKSSYGADLEQLDFAKDTDAARKTINAWVENQTRDKIPDLIGPGVLRDDTRLVLTNAIYFKGRWVAPFKKEATKREPFHPAPERPVETDLMHGWGHWPYVEGPDFQALRLPYEGKELSMVVLLPKQVDGLAAIEKSLGAAALAEWLGKMRRTEIVLTLPKFKTTAAFELNQTLAAMGMADAFSQTVADFSGMTAEERLFISKVIHKAFVDVGEEGTEAAAATAVAVAPMAMPMPAPEPLVQFRADHPFICIIRHEPTGAILFMGRLADPTK